MATYRSGNATVSIDDAQLKALVDGALERAGGTIARDLERGVRDVYEDAYRQWPVKSGRSKAALKFHTDIDVDSGRISARITNEVSRDGLRYSSLITTPVREGMQSILTLLIKRPLSKWRARFIAEAGPAIAAAAKPRG